MKNILKWTFIILIAVVAMAAGMFCLARYFDTKDAACDNSADCNTAKPITKTFNRHYTKLNLS